MNNGDSLRRLARQAEDSGYSTFGMADHFMLPFAPLVALQAVADATTTIRLTQVVLAQDFRHPAVLAKELATLDVLSAGRVEVGIGAGWMGAEFEQAGIQFDPASVRIERLIEAVTVIDGLFGEDPFNFTGRYFHISNLNGTPKPVQHPRPPIMIGGGGPKLLAAAARKADIIQVLPGAIRGLSPDPNNFAGSGYQEKVDWIRDAAGSRFAEIELAALLFNVTITNDVDRALGELLESFKMTGVDDAAARMILASPVVAIGSLEQVCEKLLETQDTYGFSYFASPVGARLETLAPVIARLGGLA